MTVKIFLKNINYLRFPKQNCWDLKKIMTMKKLYNFEIFENFDYDDDNNYDDDWWYWYLYWL